MATARYTGNVKTLTFFNPFLFLKIISASETEMVLLKISSSGCNPGFASINFDASITWSGLSGPVIAITGVAVGPVGPAVDVRAGVAPGGAVAVATGAAVAVARGTSVIVGVGTGLGNSSTGTRVAVGGRVGNTSTGVRVGVGKVPAGRFT